MPEQSDLVVVASNPNELAESQKTTAEIVGVKLNASRDELKAVEMMVADARSAKIDDTAACALLRRVRHDVLYLDKVYLALSSGYIIVPNMPGDTIAIRVKRSSARSPGASGRYESEASAPRELPDLVSSGEGDYVDPWPLQTVYSDRDDPNDKTKITGYHSADLSLNPTVQLPLMFLKPTVVAKLSEAMNLKLFDEITITPGRRQDATTADPLVIGHIINGRYGQKRQSWNRNGTVTRKSLCFLIAWFFDTKDI